MAAFKTTPVATPQGNQPSIVQRFLLTSERYLLNPQFLRCLQPGHQARVEK